VEAEKKENEKTKVNNQKKEKERKITWIVCEPMILSATIPA